MRQARRQQKTRAAPAVWVRRFRAEDLDAVLADLSEADQAEGEAIVGPGKVTDAVNECVGASAMSWAALAGDEVAFVFGVTPAPQDHTKGAMWFLFTPKGEQHLVQFAHAVRPCVAKMHSRFPTLLNAVDARNTSRITWLRRLGCTILPAQPMGPAGLPFHPFFSEA